MSAHIPKTYISSVAAARDFKKTNDYISLLCRQGLVRGVLVSTQWYVDPASLASYFAEQEIVKIQHRKELSDHLAREYREHAHKIPQRFGLQTLGAVGGMTLLVGALVFASSMHVPQQNQYAAVSESQSPFFGTQAPSVVLPTSTGQAFAGATQFLSNVFSTLFGNETQVAQNVVTEPVQNSPIGSGEPRTNSAPASATVSVPGVAVSSPAVINNYPVIERIVERSVAVGGVSEEDITGRLQDLYNRLAVQISNLQNPGRESPLQNFAVSQVINNLSDVRLNGTTRADGITASSVIAGSLDVSGNTNLSGNSVVGGTLSAGTTTLASLTVSGNATTTGVAYFGTDVNIGGNTVIAGNLSVLNSNSNPGTAFAGTTTVTNLAVTNTSTSTFAGAVSSSLGDLFVAAKQGFNLLLNPYGGSVGIGTTSPAQTFAVQGNQYTSGTAFFGDAITATSTLLVLGNTTLANATSTNFFSATASSTNLFAQLASLGSLTAQSLSASGTSNFTGLASFFNGFLSLASTTIGAGTQTTGLTINGGATTTGNAYFAGGLGVGVATSAVGVLQTSGNAYVGGNLFVGGNSTTLGNSSSNTLVINSSIQSNIIPDQNIEYDLGSSSFYWRNVYVGNIVANNISAASTTIAGTASATFTINSDNVSSDAEDMDFIFFRGNVVPNALISWKSVAKRFEFNQATYISNQSGSTTQPTLRLQGVSGQTGNLFELASSTGTTLFSVDANGATLGNGFVSQASSTVIGNFTTTGNAIFGGTFSTGTTTLNNLSVTNTSTSTFAGPVTFGSNLLNIISTGQVSLGAALANASALLQLDSTSRGFLPPRLTTIQKNAIGSPSSGLILYDSDLNKLNVYNGSAWKNVGSTEIGGEVTNGTQGSVLFIGDGTVLGQDATNFSFSTSTNRLLLTQASTTRISNFGTAYFGGTATTTIDSAGNIAGAGTLAVTGNSTLANATSTNFFSTTASSTNLFSQLASLGTLSAQTFSVSGTTAFTGLATFANGFLSQASSTIGSGTQTGGLTINGGATTTGNAYFGGNVGIGTTTPGSLLSLGGLANFTTATSTFFSSGGINISSGCFAINGTCLSTGVGQALAVYATSTVGTTTVQFTGAANSAPSFSAGVLTLPSNTSYATVEVWGAGGGGGGAGNGGAGTTGGTTCFGTNATACSSPTLQATGGTGGYGFNSGGGTGGVGTGGDVNLSGGPGDGQFATVGASLYATGGTGGSAPQGGTGGTSNAYNTNGSSGNPFGGGGSGGSINGQDSLWVGSGGGSGGYSSKLITALSSSYKFTIGAGGTGGSAGTGGGTGGTGGVIIKIYTTASGGSLSLGQSQAPTQTRFTSSSGTYTVPPGVSYIKVQIVGGGGGGSSGHGAVGSAGGNTTFGSLTAGGGQAPADYASPASGGTASGGDINIPGMAGTGGGGSSAGALGGEGGSGGSSVLGGAGAGGYNQIGTAAAANSGSGGGGGGLSGATGTYVAGSGGAAGGYVQKLYVSPSASYSYSVGSGGAGNASPGSDGYAGGNGAAGIIIIDEYYGSSSNISSTGTINSGTQGQFAFFATSGTQLTGTSTLFLDTATSRLGIGTTTPWANLSVTSASQQSGSLTLFSVASTTGTSLFNIQGNGRIGIGTSSPTQALLSIANTGTATRISIDTGGTDNAEMIRYTRNGTTLWDTIVDGSGISDGYFLQDGDASNGVYLAQNSTSWTGYSDQRLKENIETYSVLDRLEDFRSVSFDWKANGVHDIGVIAQEVALAFPEVVDQGSDGELSTTTVNQAGVWGVRYDKFGALALQGLKELNLKVDARTGDLMSTSTISDLTASSTSPVVEGFSSALQAAVGNLGSVVVKMFNGIVSATVGIFNKVYAKEVHTDQLCLSDSNGETCITKSELDSLLAGIASSTPNGSGNGGSTATSTDNGSGTATSTDSIAPEIILLGNNPATITVGSVYSDPGATIIDIGSPNIGYTVSLDSATSTPLEQLQLDTSASGTHTILFSATDQAGNTGTATRTVIVSDPNAPDTNATSTPEGN